MPIEQVVWAAPANAVWNNQMCGHQMPSQARLVSCAGEIYLIQGDNNSKHFYHLLEDGPLLFLSISSLVLCKDGK